MGSQVALKVLNSIKQILSNKTHKDSVTHLGPIGDALAAKMCIWPVVAGDFWVILVKKRANHQKPGTCKLYSWRQIVCTCFQATLQTVGHHSHRPLGLSHTSSKANGCIYYSYSNLSVIGYWSKLVEFLGETTKRGSLKYKLPCLNLGKTGLLANMPLVLVTLWHCHRRELK